MDQLVAWLPLLVVGLTSLWVFVDAQSIGARKGLVRGMFDMTPGGWFVVSLLFWIVGFPAYLFKRGELLAMARAAAGSGPIHAGMIGRILSPDGSVHAIRFLRADGGGWSVQLDSGGVPVWAPTDKLRVGATDAAGTSPVRPWRAFIGMASLTLWIGVVLGAIRLGQVQNEAEARTGKKAMVVDNDRGVVNPIGATAAAAATAEPPAPEPPATLFTTIQMFYPHMGNTVNETDKGAVALAVAWAGGRYPWSQLAARPETTLGLAKKNSDEERGKRLCFAGSVVQIERVSAAKGEMGAIYEGRLVNDALDVVSFLSVGSTGDLVERSTGRFCGIVTGLATYSNAGGGTTHSVRVVGMFDLPENRKEPKAPPAAVSMGDIKACCAGLHSAGPGATRAAAVCDAAFNTAQTTEAKSAARVRIKAAMAGAPMPADCPW